MTNSNSPMKDDNLTSHIAIAYADGKIFGSKSSITVYEPDIELGSDAYSGGWSYLISGVRNTEKYDFISTGWFVWPKNYGDKHARLSILWRSHTNGSKSNCFNLLCPGFVQISSDVPLGAQLSPDNTTGDWWLGFGPNEKWVGYWPKKLFKYLNNEADRATWGGTVSAPKNSATPSMGSGHFSSEGFQKSAMVSKTGIVDENNYFVVPNVTTANILTDKPDCYTVSDLGTADDGIGFFFGGPVCNS
ncbi:hypothetical protein LUZ60_015033 [Juncus effusus]|nr:hypothetical protein LUZ60_015033 [Juncus effusus]